MNPTQLLIGGLSVLVAGIVLTILGQHQVGLTLIAAAAAELGVKGYTLTK